MILVLRQSWIGEFPCFAVLCKATVRQRLALWGSGPAQPAPTPSRRCVCGAQSAPHTHHIRASTNYGWRSLQSGYDPSIKDCGNTRHKTRSIGGYATTMGPLRRCPWSSRLVFYSRIRHPKRRRLERLQNCTGLAPCLDQKAKQWRADIDSGENDHGL